MEAKARTDLPEAVAKELAWMAAHWRELAVQADWQDRHGQIGDN
jgi:hypothetical protein